MEEIYSTGEKTFKLWYESPDQRENAIIEAQTMSNLNVESLAPTCVASKYVGDVVNLSSSPTSGTPPYTYTFWKTLDGINRTLLGTADQSISTHNYTLTTSDIGNPTFGVTVRESCGGLTNEEYCTIAVSVACTTPIANLTVT